MTEQRGFVFCAHIAPAHFAAYLDAAVVPAGTWDDWARLGNHYYGFAWDNPADVSGVLEQVARRAQGKNYRQLLAESLASDDWQPGGTFTYLPGGDVRMARALFGENLTTTIAVLAQFRGLESFLAEGETAWVVRRDVWWGAPEEREVEAVLVIEAGRSRLLSPQDPRYADLAAQAQAAFAGVEAFGSNDTDDARNYWPDDSQALLAWAPPD